MKKSTKQVHPRFGAEKAFGSVVREIRKGMKLSQEEFAWKSGLDRTTVSMLERGLMSPTLRTMVKLSTALQLAVSTFIARAERSNLFK
jgi:transcriptional regulator with XRE-family HTH domain